MEVGYQPYSDHVVDLTSHKELSMTSRDACVDGRALSILHQPRPFFGWSLFLIHV